MKFRYMGKSGLKVSRVCLGTMTFGQENWGCDKKTSINIVNRFIENGGNFIDTADMYGKGLSEEYIGDALKSHKRDDIVLATKCYFAMGDMPTSKGLSRKHIFEACEASLKRLKTDYIDLYQTHGPDPRTPMEETMNALNDLITQGKVRYIGCSNIHGWQIVKANSYCSQFGLEKYISAQHLYNLILRDVEREVLPVIKDQGMGFICWSPLASGMLTGKYKHTEKPPGDSRMDHRSNMDLPRYWHDNGFKLVDAVKNEAGEFNRTPAQIALSWLLYNRLVAAVIIGVRTVEQLDDLNVVGDWNLPEDAYERLTNTVPFKPGYPQAWFDLVSELINYNDTEF